MRAISHHPNYSICLHKGEEETKTDFRGNAYVVTKQEPIIANFEGGLFPHEVEVALQTFVHELKGVPEGVNKLTRLAVYDTEAQGILHDWTPEFQKQIEDRLVQLQKVNANQFIIIDSILPKPWPTYGDMEADEILAFIEQLGIDPASVKAYEQSTRNRPDLISGLLDLIESHETDGISVSVA